MFDFIIGLVSGCMIGFGLAASYLQDRFYKSAKKKLAKKIVDCFCGNNYPYQKFIIFGNEIDIDGETSFIKKSDIDKLKDDINKVINE